jgi:hypothetical protein
MTTAMKGRLPVGLLVFITHLVACTAPDVEPGAVEPAAAEPDAASPAMLVLAPASFDFDTVYAGSSSLPTTFTVTNTGGPSGRLVAAVGDGASYSVSGGTCAGAELAAGASCTVRVQFAPSTAEPVGGKATTLTVSDGSGQGATARLFGTAVAPAQIALAPAAHDFGGTAVGANAEAAFTVRNDGRSALGPLAVMVSGTTGDFAIAGDDCPATLGAGAGCTVVVRFAPSSVGPAQATLVVSSTSGVVWATLSGLGTAPEPAALRLAPLRYDFGAVALGASSPPATFTVTNDGGATTGILGASVDDGADYSVTGTCLGKPLAGAGATCTLIVRFHPTGRAGAKPGLVTVTAAPGGSLGAALTGTVPTQAQLALTPTTRDFGRVAVGSASAETSLTVANTGQSPTGTLAFGLSGQDAESFVVHSTDCPAALDAMASCHVAVTFAPGSVGDNTAVLTVAADPGGTTTTSLAGTGTARLTVDMNGTGTGTVTSSPDGIRCGSSCAASFATGAVTLTAVAHDDSELTAWSGGCTGAGPCTVALAAATTVTATFTLKPPVLSLAPASQSFAELAIGSASDTSAIMLTNTGPSTAGPPTVGLTGPDAQSFAIAANGCTAALPSNGTCTIRVQFQPTTIGAKAATLTASASPGHAATTTLRGTATALLEVAIPGGGGSIRSSPDGISCPGTCRAIFSTPVTLTADPDGASAFGGWSGACAGPSPSCAPSFASAAASVTAAFTCAAGAAVCAGSCVDEATDPANCGACGHSCLGSACAAGMCQPVTLASSQVQPIGIAVSGTNVYWVDAGHGPPTNDGAIRTVPVGGGAVTTLASGQGSPYAIAVRGPTAYWTNFYGEAVMAVALAGGAPTPLAWTKTGYSIAVDETNVYWPSNASGSEGIMTMPISGGVPTPLAAGQFPYQIAVDATNVYWTDQSAGTVMQLAKAGGAPIALASGQGAPTGLAIDATSVYFTNASLNGTVQRVPIGGGPITTIASGQSNPGEIVVDDANVYWKTGNADGAIVKAPVAGGTPTTLVPIGWPSVFGMALDSQYLYWTNAGDGTVMRVAK